MVDERGLGCHPRPIVCDEYINESPKNGVYSISKDLIELRNTSGGEENES